MHLHLENNAPATRKQPLERENVTNAQHTWVPSSSSDVSGVGSHGRLSGDVVRVRLSLDKEEKEQRGYPILLVLKMFLGWRCGLVGKSLRLQSQDPIWVLV